MSRRGPRPAMWRAHVARHGLAVAELRPTKFLVCDIIYLTESYIYKRTMIYALGRQVCAN